MRAGCWDGGRKLLKREGILWKENWAEAEAGQAQSCTVQRAERSTLRYEFRTWEQSRKRECRTQWEERLEKGGTRALTRWLYQKTTSSDFAFHFYYNAMLLWDFSKLCSFLNKHDFIHFMCFCSHSCNDNQHISECSF